MYKYTVPIGASAIALVTAITCCILAASVSAFICKAFSIVMVVGYVLPPILIGVMLALTIKTARKQKPKPEIPKRLCFHDENDLEADEQIQQSEGFDFRNEQVQVRNPGVEQELPNIKKIFVKPYKNEG